MTHTFEYTLVYSELVPGGSAFNAYMKSYTDALENAGGRLCGDPKTPGDKPLLYFMSTGGTEQALLDIRHQRRKHAPHEAVWIIAHPAYNSLPASLEVLARLQQDDEKGRIFYLKSPQDQTGLNLINAALTEHVVAAAMKAMRIGLIGNPSDWLVASSPAHEIVQEVWGPTVVPVTMEEVNQAISEASMDAIEPLRDSLVVGATEVREPSAGDLDNVVRVYLSLRKVIEKHALDALTVRCFDLVLGLQTTGCYGLAQLTDEGVIAGCEGDLVSTVAMLWVHKLLDQTPWMANPAQLDETNNTLWLAHCTVPRGIVEDYGLRSHFESGLGVGIQGTLANGNVTLIRLGGKRMEKIWLAEGEIIQAGNAEDLCRTQAEITLSNGHVSDLLKAPLGNHIIMVRGHHATQLEAWHSSMISSKK